MARKLEDTKGVGSVRVGTIGTISSLMNKELESSSSSQAPSSSRRTPQSAPVSVSCGDTTFKLRKSVGEARSNGTSSRFKHSSPENVRRTRGENQHRIPVLGHTPPKRQKQKAPPEEVSCTRDGNIRKSPELPRKTRSYKRTHKIPMLGSEDITLDKTPKREKPARKVSVVEIVDTNCANPAGSLSNRLKKLGFSKLSQTIV